MWLFLTGVAFAQDWSVAPYVEPTINLSAGWVNGRSVPQIVLGGEAGLLYRMERQPHWLGHSRVSATTQYGISSTSIGYDFRIGSFFGPDGKWVRYQGGPDFFFNGYGTSSSTDYTLDPSFGIAVPQTVLVKLHWPWFGLFAAASPGWVFNPDRINSELGPLHELSLTGAAVFNIEGITVMVGYTRTWNAVGVMEGLVLSGAI